jgi:hypothetical protein
MAACERLSKSSPRFAAWSELIDNYGVVENAEPWGNNAIASDAFLFACGRLSRPDQPAEHAHDPDELALCTELSIAITEVLAGAAPVGSDEGSHTFFPFAAPALASPTESVKARGREGGLVTIAELQAACGGALVPDLRFDITSIDGMLEKRAQRVADHYMDAEESSSQVAPFQRLSEWVRAQDGTARASATYFFPWSNNAGLVLSVFPHFAVCRTGAGSIVGAASMSVWT